MLIAFCRVQIENFRMTDSMNFGPDWIRNLPSEGSTGGGTAGGTKYQLAEFRYGREEMLALFDKSSKPPPSVTNFKNLYSESTLIPLALLPTSEEERSWQGRPNTLSVGPSRGRGGSLERGGRISRGRGYQYTRSTTYDGDQSEWSPRKEYNQRPVSMENWRRARVGDQEDDGWRGVGLGRSTSHEKWGRSTSWRGEGDTDEKSVLPERSNRSGWNDTSRAPQARKSWDTDDHLPEWATENPTDGGGSFDDKGAFHGSDDEQLEHKPSTKREIGLQKSVSQQHISSKTQPHPLSSSKSTISLTKSDDSPRQDEQQYREQDVVVVVHKKDNESDNAVERNKSVPNIPEKIDKQDSQKERAKSEGPSKVMEKQSPSTNGPMPDSMKNEDSDFERLQEDLVLKLMGDEEAPKPVPNSFEVSGVPPPPPNLIPQVPIQDRWFYQDPQGQMQGPFSNLEMAEWYKAGYFSNQLKVRRNCDERFFMLGELIAMCGGNPFQSTMRFPVLKNDVTKMPDTDMLQFQYLTQMAAYKQAQARIIQEPWSALTLQQQELAAQRLIMQQQQVSQDLQYMQQSQTANPLIQMISQLHQANKLPGQGLVDKPPQTIPSAMDPHMQLHMGNLLSMQNRLPNSNITSNLPSGMPGNLGSSLPPESMSSSLPNLQTGLPNLQNALPNLPGGMPPVSIGGNINLSRPTSHGNVDQISGNQDSDPITNLLKQLQQQKQQQQQQQQQPQQIDSLWQQNQFSIPTATAVTNHWQSQQNEIPSSMWDIQQNTTNSPSVVPVSTIESQLSKAHEQEQKLQQQQQHQQTSQQINQQKPKQEKEKEKPKDELSNSEKKKKKELEEKQAKKEAEEKRKQEQRKQEAEKKLAEEKRKKEEERIKKEQEKARKEAEEKRMRELEEKRRLKEQRKNEEESRKRLEELKKLEEERTRQELRDAEARRQAEEKRLQQEQMRMAKVAPWSQSNSTLGMSLAEIQKAEREKRAQDAAIQLQKLQEKEIQQQQLQQQQEKNAGIHLSWAKKPVEPRKVKSLAEIQAEEQERLAKQAAEIRLQKEKEKEILPIINTSSSIWSNQNINWGNPSTNSQWSSSTGGFWDDSSSKQAVQKPSSVTKSNSTNSVNIAAKQQLSQQKQQQQSQQLQQQQSKTKTKKEETSKSNHNNNNNGSLDEFTNWCYKSLSNISSNVDIPTFVTFLRELESAFDVREYCKEYLGESNATHQFAISFLEKRRSFRPKNNAHKDDMCSPAPAITPSLQHSTEFQEVKGKNKKNKKSKMLKVDARILGFNVTSAPDRINVGDRDYGDNS